MYGDFPWESEAVDKTELSGWNVSTVVTIQRFQPANHFFKYITIAGALAGFSLIVVVAFVIIRRVK